MKLNERVGKVESAKAPRKLNLFDRQDREIPKAKDGLRSGDEVLSEVADNRGNDRAGKDPHVKVEPDGETTYKHEPSCVPCGLFARGGNHFTEQLGVSRGANKPGVSFGKEKGKGRGE